MSNLTKVNNDFQANIITAEMTRNASKGSIKAARAKGNIMSPWANAEKSLDNTTEVMGTQSSKQDLKSNKNSKSKVKLRDGSKEHSKEKSNGQIKNDSVKVMSRASRNLNSKQKFALQKGRGLMPAPY